MIRALVDAALNNRFIVLALATLLLVWGAVSFHNLPVEAYPDVANNYVQIITQWPGRAAEEVEQQVTIPIEIQYERHSAPHASALRFAFWPLQRDADLRRRFQQRLESRKSSGTAFAGHSAPRLEPQMGTDWSPVGQIYWYTLHSTNPKYDLMELKSIEDWTLEKEFKSVPNVVDVSSFGGITREYQVRMDPEALIAYGLSIGQVEQQLANNNANAGGSFVEAGQQQINVRASRLVQQRSTTSSKPCSRRKTERPLRVRDIATVDAGPQDSPRADSARPFTATTAKLWTTTTWWKESFSCARAPTPTTLSRPFTKK